jgi:hypothetical protein
VRSSREGCGLPGGAPVGCRGVPDDRIGRTPRPPGLGAGVNTWPGPRWPPINRRFVPSLHLFSPSPLSRDRRGTGGNRPHPAPTAAPRPGHRARSMDRKSSRSGTQPRRMLRVCRGEGQSSSSSDSYRSLGETPHAALPQTDRHARLRHWRRTGRYRLDRRDRVRRRCAPWRGLVRTSGAATRPDDCARARADSYPLRCTRARPTAGQPQRPRARATAGRPRAWAFAFPQRSPRGRSSPRRSQRPGACAYRSPGARPAAGRPQRPGARPAAGRPEFHHWVEQVTMAV